jgi:hypothetical protein
MKNKVIQKYKITLLSFLLLLLFVNCTDFNNEILSHKQDEDLVGKWEVESIENLVNVEEIDDKYFSANTDSVSLIIFFGPSAWHFSIGKYFYFKEGGELETNILSEKQPELMNIKYKNDKKLMIYTVPKINGDTIAAYTDIVILNEKKMVWELNGLLKVTFVKFQ